MIREVHACSRRTYKKALHSRAWLNGVDVSRRCFYADDRRGIVRLYDLDAAGHYYRRGGSVAKIERHGKVRIERVRDTWCEAPLSLGRLIVERLPL